MLDTINVLVVGSLNAQKRFFIQAVAEIDIISTDRPLPLPPEDTSIVEFGRITLDEDCVLYLFGCNLLMLSRLAGTDFLNILREADGFCLLMDSCDEHSFYEAKALIKYLEPLPYIVVANNQDRDDAMSVGQIRREMRLPDETPMMACVATEREAVRQVLLTLLAMIRPDLQERIE
jgi:uncharacterized protein